MCCGKKGKLQEIREGSEGNAKRRAKTHYEGGGGVVEGEFEGLDFRGEAQRGDARLRELCCDQGGNPIQFYNEQLSDEMSR